MAAVPLGLPCPPIYSTGNHYRNGVPRWCTEEAIRMNEKETVYDVCDAGRAAGVRVDRREHDPSAVMLSLMDQRSGNTVVREVRRVAEVGPAVAQMRREMSTRQRRSASQRAAERALDEE